MSKGKKSFILYLDQQELFNKLPDEIAGKLIKHIFSYVNCENPEANDLLLDIAFSPIKQSLKRDLSKWETQLEQRSKAGKISAQRRATKANEVQRKATTVESRSTNPTDSVSVSVSVNESVSVSEVTKDKVTKRFSPPDVMEVWGYMIAKGCKADTQCTEAHRFCDHFESNGWKVGGKTKMVSWKAAVRNWLKRNGNERLNGNNQGAGKKLSAYERARAANAEYRQPNEREMVVGTDDRHLGRAVDEGAGRETIEHVGDSTFIDYE